MAADLTLIAALFKIMVDLLPSRKKFEWSDILTDIDEETRKTMQPMVEDFFEPDDIDPMAYLANYQYLLAEGHPQHFSGWADEDKMKMMAPFRTQTVSRFQSILDRPLGFPHWFMAAYPDVAYWLSQDAEGILSNRGITGIDIDSPDADAQLLDDERQLRTSIRRRVIDYYKTHVSDGLECRRV